ncbi:cobyrinate a,c-diamide synthase [Marinibaculum pumilum]|uniref:Cobyrinate a,c-diamide synthase n=1 Tax=Marinibaculum pumilum TaxID=1766165 RepID=A0ABV7KXI3_9PROT
MSGTTAMPPGLLVSAPASGTGKTTVMLGLARALADHGLAVQPFKCGPDYIDPAFHRAAAGHPSYNLDSWSMAPAQLHRLAGAASGADLALAEGAMGLFDGAAAPGATGIGASADIAALTGWPVLLVLDVSGQSQTAAAIARGLAGHRTGVTVAGVVLNRVASPRHERLVRDGMAAAGIAVFGALPRRPDLSLPERHLGLVQAEERPDLEAAMAGLGRFVSEHLDLDAILAAARCGAIVTTESHAQLPDPPGQRIALARDRAFSFVYPHLLDAWRRAGAEILPFSPLADEGPAPQADCCWLPGGYPELHAGALAAAGHFRQELRDFADSRPVHGECGGYMAMGAGLVDGDGVRHEMAGLLGLVSSFAQRKLHLGYRRAVLAAPMAGFAPGTALRGHEFHYASVLAQPDPPLAEVQDAGGAVVTETGSRRGHATGTFFHLVAGS